MGKGGRWPPITGSPLTPLAPPQVMEYYCESCETAMCQECTVAEHREHVTVPLRDVVEQHKASLRQQLDAIKSRYGWGWWWQACLHGSAAGLGATVGLD